MATPRINGYTLTSLEGEVPSYAHRVMAKERAGVDGYTYLRLGKRSEPFSLRSTTLCSSRSAARRRARDYESLAGSFVTVDMPSGEDFGTVMCLSVSTQVRDVLLATDGSSALVYATWQLQRAR